ncbi:hypothetical protein AND_002539 [Anopheles darlingi]|uniref:Aquaporin n=2 Tax=Anopheles darlingi TaxID=43151 RepID=W5JQV7_ANODA|nr:hypothetical protein AND_002539 [Anopheles darlingi]
MVEYEKEEYLSEDNFRFDEDNIQWSTIDQLAKDLPIDRDYLPILILSVAYGRYAMTRYMVQMLQLVINEEQRSSRFQMFHHGQLDLHGTSAPLTRHDEHDADDGRRAKTTAKGAGATYQQLRQQPRRSGPSVVSSADGYQYARGFELATSSSPASRKSQSLPRHCRFSHSDRPSPELLVLRPRVIFPFTPFTDESAESIDASNNTAYRSLPPWCGTSPREAQAKDCTAACGAAHHLSKVAMNRSTLDNISVFLAELIGTGLLVMLGCMGCVSGLGHTPGHFELAINFGLIVMIIVQVFGCVSGSHLNPAVTAGAWVYDLVSTKMALAYVAAQCIGSFMGYGILKMLTPAAVFESAKDPGAGFCVTQPNPLITTIQAVGVEFVATMVLILVCCGVWDPRNAKHHDSVALKFGFTVGALAVAAGPYTGASMNPARSLGPVLWNGVYTAHWVYWVGPLTAGFLTAFAYKAVFRREVPVELPNHELRALNTDK